MASVPASVAPKIPSTAGADPDPRLARLEAVLFLAREPLASRKLAQFANLADGTEARTLVRRLNARYDADGRAIRVEEVAGGYQLLTRAAFAPWLRKLHQTPVEIRLSAPALETLAVVAYRQPVPRAEIEAVRGVQCGEMLRQLMERDLARIVGRGDELGRPFLYGTTRRFLQVFGLRDLEDLPRADRLRRPAVGAQAGSYHNERPPEAQASQAVNPQDRLEEPAVNTAFPLELDSEELLGRPGAADFGPGAAQPASAERAAADDEDEVWDDDDDEEDDDEEDEDDDFDDDEDDLEDDEWEEVDDEDDEELDDDEEDDDWDDDDEDEDDDDWDDDEEEDEEDEAE